MEKFYIGLDIGTNSVGIACTDENYKLLRAKGQDLWAVRLFDDANPAAERRTKRAMRRRLMRRRRRIELLQELFTPLMTDETFFIRLNNSPYLIEDKRGVDTKYVIFADPDYCDADFYRDYPTIYHLRSALINGTAKKDIRLYYIAMHHLLKYRGNFLFEGQKLDNVRDIKRVFDRLNAATKDAFEDEDIAFETSALSDFKKTAVGAGGIRTKAANCEKVLGADKPETKAMMRLMVGGKVKTSEIFDGYDGGADKLCFKNLDDAEFEGWSQEFTDEQFELIAALRAVYNYLTFEKVLGGYEYISDAMVGLYDKHSDDLKKLKVLLLREGRQSGSKKLYNDMFRRTKEQNNYAAYVGYSKVNGVKRKCKRCAKVEDFYKYVKKTLEGLDDSPEKQEILGDIDSETFMPRLLNADNGVFPYQVNESELEAILKRAEQDFPEFTVRDVDGYTLSEKIKSILTFRIPYYVGPLNTYHSDKGGNSWMVRKGDGRILPWNFDDMVDRAESNAKFMRRMTAKCSYLRGKDVLPKCSIIYQTFNTLNLLNKVRINNRPISVELKQRMFDGLFKTRKKVTKNNVRDWLVAVGEISESEKKTVEITGMEDGWSASMSTYVSLKTILGGLVDKREDICENIVLWHTLNTDKNIVERLILAQYGDIPEIGNNIKELKGLNFKDFGRLSKEFLCDIPGRIDENTGEVKTILGELYATNMNFNELLHSYEYEFEARIAEENGETERDVGYKDIEELYVSPAVRRGIWQALLMCDEYVSAVGRAPDKIFVEVTRDRDKEKQGQRTESRKTQLVKIYKEAGGIDPELMRELGERGDNDLRREKLYLYFRQLGKCMYSGEKIDLDELLGDVSNNIYDVDHIVPRALTKDDSLENKVLVKSVLNRSKSDTYPLPDQCRTPFATEHWKLLVKKGLLSSAKYAKLTRTDALTPDELKEFINRQIVFTGQTNKAVAELLARKYPRPGTKIVYSKASNVSDFRKTYGFVKCRETNDLHHARDAYLNIVVGNVYDTRFTSMYFDKKRNAPISDSAIKKLFTYDIDGAWDMNASLPVVKKTMAKPSMRVTQYSYVNRGAFYDETIYAAGDSGVSTPRKENTPLVNINKYGGYKSLKTAYFVIVTSTGKKGARVKTIEAVPVLVEYKTKGDIAKLTEYFISKGLKDPEITAVLKNKATLRYNGTPAVITGVTDNRMTVLHAVQWFSDRDTDAYFKALEKCADLLEKGLYKPGALSYPVNRSSKNPGITIDAANDLKIYDMIVEQLSRPVYCGLSGARNFVGNLRDSRGNFERLAVCDQVKVLLEILKFVNGRRGLSDLTLIGLKKGSGVLRINKDITDADVELVNQSPCGLHTVIRKL